jgi:hypothetical protein
MSWQPTAGALEPLALRWIGQLRASGHDVWPSADQKECECYSCVDARRAYVTVEDYVKRYEEVMR